MLQQCNGKDLYSPKFLEMALCSGAIRPTFRNLEVGLVFKQVVVTAKTPGSFLTLEKIDMKKTLIALAAVAATGAAFAQSSVTLSGGYGVAVDKAVGARAALKQTDGYINFAATEDLGGGLKAGVDAQLAWNGRSAIAAENTNFNLSGGFGKVEFRNIAAGSANLGSLASLSTDVNGILGGDTNLNYLRYTAPELYTGLTLQAGSYNAMGTGATLPAGDIGTKAVSTFFKATYATGPVTVAGDYRLHDGRTRVWAAYDAGVAKVEYAAEVAFNSANSAKKKQSEIGLTVPAGAWAFGLHYGTKANQGKGTEVAAVYSLSKRTNVNVSFGQFTGLSATNAALTGNASRVRLMHTF